jgi:hypothetical protein
MTGRTLAITAGANAAMTLTSNPRPDVAETRLDRVPATLPAGALRGKALRAVTEPTRVGGPDDAPLSEVALPTWGLPTSLGSLVLDRGLITNDQLTAAIARQKRTGRRLGQVLVDRRSASRHSGTPLMFVL